MSDNTRDDFGAPIPTGDDAIEVPRVNDEDFKVTDVEGAVFGEHFTPTRELTIQDSFAPAEQAWHHEGGEAETFAATEGPGANVHDAVSPEWPPTSEHDVVAPESPPTPGQHGTGETDAVASEWPHPAGETEATAHIVPADQAVTAESTIAPSEETYQVPIVTPSPAELEPLPERRYLDRELSWLAFNARVLELAEDEATPLLERARFLAIFASNLDEFFMVRVAGLKRRIAAGFAVPSATGMSPTRLVENLTDRAKQLMVRHAAQFHDVVAPALAAEGIRIVRYEELGESEQNRLRKLFRSDIFPVK